MHSVISSGKWGSLHIRNVRGTRLAVATPRGHVDYPVRQASGWIVWQQSLLVSKELKRRARAEMEHARKTGQRYANDYYARCDAPCNRTGRD